jgi:ABC transporter substrate binding protein
MCGFQRKEGAMRRRAFTTLLVGAAAAWPLVARAQAKRARIGWFTVAPHPYIDGFRRGLRELGWIEGENVVIEDVYADGHPERLPGLAAVLARVPYDLIVASGSDAVEAARAAIQSTPIVGISSTLGIGGSLARSAGNLSGIALLFDEVAAKWPELLVEVAPRVQRMGVLFDPSASAARQSDAVSTTTARSQRSALGVRQLQPPLQLGLQDAIFGGQIFDPRQQLLVHRPRDVGQDARPIHSPSAAADSQLIAPRNRSQRQPARLHWESTTHRLFYGFKFFGHTG